MGIFRQKWMEKRMSIAQIAAASGIQIPTRMLLQKSMIDVVFPTPHPCPLKCQRAVAADRVL
jgi:hypothetical protein